MIDGKAHPVDWWAIVFNRPCPTVSCTCCSPRGHRLVLIAGLSALRYYRRPVESMWKALRTGVLHRRDPDSDPDLCRRPARAEHAGAPAEKIAANGGQLEHRPNVPLVLFALPDEATKENRFEIAIPDGASLVLRHSTSGVVPGLNDYPESPPPVFPVFWGFSASCSGPAF